MGWSIGHGMKTDLNWIKAKRKKKKDNHSFLNSIWLLLPISFRRKSCLEIVSLRSIYWSFLLSNQFCFGEDDFLTSKNGGGKGVVASASINVPLPSRIRHTSLRHLLQLRTPLGDNLRPRDTKPWRSDTFHPTPVLKIIIKKEDTLRCHGWFNCAGAWWKISERKLNIAFQDWG